MKVLINIILLLSITTMSCGDSNSPSVSAIIDTEARQDNVITDTKGPDTLPHMDTTQMIVDSAVNITINGALLHRSRNNVYRALYDNWLRAYTLVHHLPASLHITYIGTVMGARGNIMDDVLKAQRDMKNYIAKDKYHQIYDSLNASQQADLQQQHAILFQKEFR